MNKGRQKGRKKEMRVVMKGTLQNYAESCRFLQDSCRTLYKSYRILQDSFRIL